MRTTPLGVYCHKLSDSGIFKLTKTDVNLTHSHTTTENAVSCYNIAIAHLLNNFGDYEGAFKRASLFVESADDEILTNNWIKMDKAKSQRDLLPVHKLIGFLMIALQFAFYYLKHNFTYEHAMRDILIREGDTDTNAAIVCGLLGARWGINGIPQSWRDATLNSVNKRSDFLRTESEQKMYDLIDQLLAKAPNDEDI
jgi:ADP-ribosyl-[dinitrogen reductase] hydrolase